MLLSSLALSLVLFNLKSHLIAHKPSLPASRPLLYSLKPSFFHHTLWLEATSNHFDLSLKKWTRNGPSGHTVLENHNISLKLPQLANPHQFRPVPFRLQNSLLEWRADLESAVYQWSQLTALLAQYLGHSDERDCLCLEIIFGIVAEIMQLEEQCIAYLDDLWAPQMTSNTKSASTCGPTSG